jgi:hypothetical protein
MRWPAVHQDVKVLLTLEFLGVPGDLGGSNVFSFLAPEHLSDEKFSSWFALRPLR